MSHPALLSRFGVIVGSLLVIGLVAAGCGGSSGGGGAKIALLLPENETPRYEAHDGPNSKKRSKNSAQNAKILYSNAIEDAKNSRARPKRR